MVGFTLQEGHWGCARSAGFVPTHSRSLKPDRRVPKMPISPSLQQQGRLSPGKKRPNLIVIYWKAFPRVKTSPTPSPVARAGASARFGRSSLFVQKEKCWSLSSRLSGRVQGMGRLGLPARNNPTDDILTLDRAVPGAARAVTIPPITGELTESR